MRGLNLPADHLLVGKSFGFTDHFVRKDTALWTTTAVSTGTATVQDLPGGVMNLTPASTNNDAVYLTTASKLFRILNGRPIQFSNRVSFTQAATDKANIFIGLVDAAGAGILVDGNAGPKTNFSGAAFFTQGGSTNWQVIYSDGTTQFKAELSATNTLNKTAAVAASSAFQLLECDIVPKTASLVDVIFKINGSTVYKFIDRPYANSAGAVACLGVKNGSANQQVVSFDDFSIYQAS